MKLLLAFLALALPAQSFAADSPWTWVCSAYYVANNDYQYVYGDNADKTQASSLALDACKKATTQPCKPSSCWRYSPEWRVAVGPNAPQETSALPQVTDKGDLSRNKGGELLNITFDRARTVTGARLTVFGKKGKGRVLVHSAIARPAKDNATNEVEAATEKMLSDGQAIDLAAGGKIEQLALDLEGYDIDGMSVTVDLTFAAPGAPENEIGINRTYPDPDPTYIFADTDKECATDAQIAAFGFNGCPYGAKVLDPWHGSSQFVCQTPGAPDENGQPTCLEGYMQDFFLAQVQCRAKK